MEMYQYQDKMELTFMHVVSLMFTESEYHLALMGYGDAANNLAAEAKWVNIYDLEIDGQLECEQAMMCLMRMIQIGRFGLEDLNLDTKQILLRLNFSDLKKKAKAASGTAS